MQIAEGIEEVTTSERLARVKRLAVESVAPHAADVDREPRFPSEALAALKKERLLGALVPKELGGPAIGMIELAAMCEVLGQHCAATAMVFAMHQIQVASIARHLGTSAFFRSYLTQVNEEQRLIASVTSEVGVGGDMRSSITGVERQGTSFRLAKAASTISYGEHADDLLVTARSRPDAPPSDQVLVLLKKGDFTLEKTGTWDTLGMRGTCSPSFQMTSNGSIDQVLGQPFADIASHTMVPFSHILWASAWLGIATASVTRARAFVRQQARAKPGTLPPTAMRLAELAAKLQAMRTNVHDVAFECEELMKSDAGIEALSTIAFALKMNNLKVTSSQMVVDIVHQALLICGIMGYKNDSKFALGRHLRDAHSAALMVGNDRIFATNASMLLVLKDD